MPHRHRSTILRTLAAIALLLTASPSSAIDGGAVAGRNRLSQATVGIGTLVAGSGSIGVSRCSGVLVSRDLVLTAAHCVKDIPLAAAVVLYDGAKPVRPAIPVASVRGYVVVATDLPREYAGLLELSLDTAILRLASPRPCAGASRSASAAARGRRRTFAWREPDCPKRASAY